jgi:hypothetical protein
MHLIYLDESGNTGTDLKDLQQPVFVLAALIVPETCWQPLEADLESSFKTILPESSFEGVEVHGSDLRGGRANFKGQDLAIRIRLRDEWLKIAQKHQLKVVYRAIAKKTVRAMDASIIRDRHQDQSSRRCFCTGRRGCR